MASRRTQGQSLSVGQSQRTQHVNHAIPQVQSAAAGLEGMGAAFSNFFGQVIATGDQIRDAAMIGEKEKIRQENEAEKIQATNDAYQGKEADPALANDRDYMDAFKSVKAGRMASDAALEFNEWYRDEWVENNRQGDLGAARDEWVKRNLLGIDDPKTQAMVLASFHQKTDSAILQHSERAYKWQVEENMMELERSIYDDVGSGEMTQDTLTSYIDMARKLDPLNPHEAVPRMMAALLNAADAHPGKAQQIVKLLDQPGTGVDGKSFADSFPNAYGDFVSGALQSYLRIDTFAEQEYWDGVEADLNDPSNWTQAGLSTLAAKITGGSAMYNGHNRAKSLMDKYTALVDKLTKEKANSSRIDATLYRGVAMDGSSFRKNFDTYLQTTHGVDSILELEPAVAADMITRMQGVVPENVKTHMSEALTNANSPEEQAKVLEILTGVKNARGDDYVNSYLSSNASRYFNHVASRLTTSKDVEGILKVVNEARAQGVDPSEVSFKALTGEKSEAAGEAVIAEQIDGAFQDAMGRRGFPANVNIDPSTMAKAVDYARTIIAERGPDSVGWEDAVEEAVGHLMSNAEVIGSRDSKQLILREVNDTENIFGDPIVKLGYEITAPNGAQMSTIDLMWGDLYSLDGFLLDPAELDGLSVTTSEQPGLYQFKDASGSFMVFEGGELFTHEESHYVMPEYDIDDPDSVEQARKDLETMMGDKLPDSIVMVPDAQGWRMMYAPHYGENDVDLESVEADYALQKFTKPEDEVKALTQAIVASERMGGLLSYGEGVNKALPDINNAQELMKFMNDAMWAGIQKNGRKHVDRYRINNDQGYRGTRRKLLVGEEAVRTRAYDDKTGKRVSGQGIEGKVTVGIGFNMDRKGARETWNTVFKGDLDFDAVYRGEKAISPAQAEMLFDYDMKYFEGVVKSASGGRSMPENQHLAILSMAYNAPSRVQDMAKWLSAGDHANVIFSMLHQGFDPNHPLRKSLAARRYREAKLYAGSDPVILAMIPEWKTYINNWR